jgi:hypothetical protein
MQYFKSVVLTVALATACGGRVDTPPGRGNVSFGGGGPVPSSGGGSSGAPSGGAQSGGGAHAGGATQGCQSPRDCPVPECMPCPDGSVVCPSVECMGGNCVAVISACPDVIAGSCNPVFCSSEGTGVGCCLTSNGPCGVDYGNGCVERQACPYGGCTSPPTKPVRKWIKPSCGPAPCDGIPPPPCDPTLGQSAGAPCITPGENCTLGGVCFDLLVCAERDPCLLI